ncbi:5-oxoprolinase subunit PxpB [Pontibacter chitinilyticus]|uniref:5-oxoprolinase subunit PxpB n=1 Tax=Pontibacter chitinilyticus TaxID=2674989 RepID=UPI003218E81C
MKQKDLHAMQLYPMGDAAVVVQFGDSISEATHALIQNFAAYLQQHPFRGLVEFVPAYTTVTIYYDPWLLSEQGKYNPYTKVVDVIEQTLPQVNQRKAAPNARVVEIPVCYGGTCGPDLAFVARLHKLSQQEVIQLHTSAAYKVYMLGFSPGFPYLGGMQEKLATPRKETPSPRIPAGTVGIAGNQTGIYPSETPGGWQLIGRTPLLLFDAYREAPSLLQAGDEVRFYAITKKEFEKRKELVHAA